MQDKAQDVKAREIAVRALITGITNLKVGMASKKVDRNSSAIESLPSEESEFDMAGALVDAFQSIYNGECAVQMLVEYVLSDDATFTASSYAAAMILAKLSKRPDVVLPYLSRWMEMFLAAGLPQACHEQMREIFAATTMYGRVPSLGYMPLDDIMTHLKFHDRGKVGFHLE
jgi:hypothetical protein